jgi:hypothetical protein
MGFLRGDSTHYICMNALLLPCQQYKLKEMTVHVAKSILQAFVQLNQLVIIETLDTISSLPGSSQEECNLLQCSRLHFEPAGPWEGYLYLPQLLPRPEEPIEIITRFLDPRLPNCRTSLGASARKLRLPALHRASLARKALCLPIVYECIAGQKGNQGFGCHNTVLLAALHRAHSSQVPIRAIHFGNSGRLQAIRLRVSYS